MCKYVAYYRVSTKKQGLGIASQKSIVDYFTKEGDKIVAHFEDVATGTNTNRQGLKDALTMVKEMNTNGEKTFLIVAKSDRLSRSVVDALTIYEDINEMLVCCDIPSTDKFTLTIMYAVAEREALLCSIRTKAALKHTTKKIGREQGVDTSKARKIALDTRREARKTKLKNAHATATMMREGSKTYQQIANHLNKIKETTSRGSQYTPTAVKRLLAIEELKQQMELF